MTVSDINWLELIHESTIIWQLAHPSALFFVLDRLEVPLRCAYHGSPWARIRKSKYDHLQREVFTVFQNAETASKSAKKA